MKTPIHRDNRLDDLDAREFEAMLLSKPWRQYTERLSKEYARLVHYCATEAKLVELRRAQGGAAALECALSIPRLLLSEMKKKPNNPA